MSRPSYQSKAVESYLSAHDPKYPKGTFNRGGRAFPDVAVLGANVTLSDQGEITVSGGTSAATPLFAGMINRINDERILAGKKAVGFLNQILYQHPEVFTDVSVKALYGKETIANALNRSSRATTQAAVRKASKLRRGGIQ